ncbi:Kv channel-interacting protein 2-like [Saccostrea cucullata]|uniref:Kv channel-interacting protein 2-like n=1 Tax=Saccostrea cuccullata TaxID=36930 RepID=UPI002ED66584
MLVRIAAVCVLLIVQEVLGAGMTLEQMSAQVVHRVNPKGSHVTYDELRHFLDVNYDRNHDGCVSYSEFTAVWTVIYHDSIETSTQFVKNMDMDHDGCLDDIEVLVNGARTNHHAKIGYPMGSHDLAHVLEVYHPTVSATGSTPDPGVVG